MPGLLRDKRKGSGTDADIAIAYRNDRGALCLWLIEHKLTEAGFTTCGGRRSKRRQAKHDCAKPFAELVENPSACYYHDARRFAYWEITADNSGFFPNAGGHTGCPFRGGTNQLWRNQLMGLAIERAATLPYRRVAFSVVHHPGNRALKGTLDAYGRLIADDPSFTVFTAADAAAAAQSHADDELQSWLDWYRELYGL